MENIKVSIIVPVYNVSKYLRECIDCIIKQTYKNLEIILIDDGSIDDSGKICDEYASKDNRIVVIHQDNQGVSKTRNNGINMATGKYLTFIDSDDLISEQYIELLLNNINDSSLSVCTIKQFDKDIGNININHEIEKLSKDNFIGLCKYNLINTPCCKLFNTSILKDNNITFDINLSLGEDLLFNLDYFNYIDDINIIHKELYYYRRCETNTLSNGYKLNMKDIQMMLFDSFTKYFKSIINTDEQYQLYDRYRYGIIILILDNEFKNKKISFLKRVSNARKVLKNKEVKKRIRDIKYAPRKLNCFLLSHNMVLFYKIINKLRNI